MKPVVLLFHITGKKLSSVSLSAARFGIKAIAVPENRMGLSLGELLSGTDTVCPGAPFEEELLVLCHVPSQFMNLFLQDLRRQGAPVSLKAVLTETNQSWCPKELARELAAERDAIQKGITAHQK